MDRTELNALSSVLNEALLLVDPDGTIAEINRTAADLLGHPANDLRGSSLFSLLRDDPDDLKDHLRRAAGTSAAMPFSLRLASADGTDRTLRCDTTRVASPDTSVLLLMRLRTHAAGVKEFTELRTKIDELAAEIHQRRRAERIIESEKEALEAILSGRPLAETFDTLLRSLEEIAPSGMAASILLLDKSRRRLVHLSAPSLPDAYNEAIDGIEIGPEAGSCGTAVYLEEAVVVTDIETDPLWNNWKDLALEHDLRACWSTPIPSKKGEVLGTFAMYFSRPRKPSREDEELIDLMTNTAALAIESRRGEEQTKEALAREREARAEAEKANRLKGEFLATVSHELRTPLTSILGWTRLLQLDASREEIADGLSAIESSARAQSQLVDDLLDVSRISLGRMKLETRPVNLVDVVRSAAATVKPTADARRIDVSVNVPDQIPAVDGDPRRLHQIVWNLLSNAIKFSPVGGNVEVRLDETDDAARVSVIDEGEGIDPEFQPRLFGRFNQAEETMTRSRGGLGLGLSIVKDLVELHGGMIDFESEPGKGSCFYFEVPLGAKGEHESPTPEESLSLDGSELDGVHILIVEDDLATREFLRSLLDRAGASVAEAGSVDEALEKIDQPTPRVLISDLGLPETTGLDLIRRIDAARLPQVKIALSAYLRETQASEVLAAGFDTFLSKPIEPERLLTEIRSHLDATG